MNGVNIAAIPGGGGLAVSIDNLNCNNPYNQRHRWLRKHQPFVALLTGR